MSFLHDAIQKLIALPMKEGQSRLSDFFVFD